MSWLTARELAGLPGMNAAVDKTRMLLERLGVPSRKRLGRVGGGHEYDTSSPNLPAATRRALVQREAGARAEAALKTLDFAPSETPLPTPLAPVPKPPRRPPSDGDKAVADARLILVNAMLDQAEALGTKRAAAALALQLVSGQAEAKLQAAAKTANLRSHLAAISPRSLERWYAAYRALGWNGLLPAPLSAPQAARGVEDDVAAVLGLYHSKDARWRNLTEAAKEVARRLGLRDAGGALVFKPLYARARRALDRLGQDHDFNTALIKSRHSGAQRDAKLPFTRRDTSGLEPNDVWLIDGHTFKAKVRHPDHGAPFAPELTVVIDAATRMIVGWSVAYSENVLAVGGALSHAIGQWGPCAILYGDNGSGETAKQMDCPIDGFCVRFGITHKTGLPGKPQGHGLIERSWRTHAINAARQFGSYQGRDVDAGTFRKAAAELAKEQRAVKRAEQKQTGEVIRLSPKAPSWAQFYQAIEQMVREYNLEHRHRSLPKHEDGPLAGLRMTPAELWAMTYQRDEHLVPSPQELRHHFMPSVLRTAQRGEVTFLNQVYAAPELMRRDVEGHEVSVRYDWHDPAFVLVYKLDGEFVCEAQFQANKKDYFAKPVIDMAKEKRAQRRVKLREQQIDMALRELQPSVQTITPVSLPGPGVQIGGFFAPPVGALDHSTLEEAGASSLAASVPPSDTVSSSGAAHASAAGRPSFFETQSQRYEWLMRHRDQWIGEDADWVNTYVTGEDYADLRDYYQSRGLAWEAGNEGEVFKGAR